MRSGTRHFTKCVVAGIVALLPMGGAVFTILWLESAIAGPWLVGQPFYVPGLGLALAIACIYLVGLFVTTFVGRWLFRRADRLLEGLPLLGTLYQSLKEVLGYDSSKQRFFRAVVAVPADGGLEIGLVTGETQGPDGCPRVLVFVPGSPNPANGRLVLVDPAEARPLDARVADALRALVSIGKTPLREPPAAGGRSAAPVAE
jgi:uncharacterized membrane protein